MAGNQRRLLIENSKIEGSKTTTKVTVEVLWSFISQQRLPSTNQAVTLIDAVRGVGQQLIAANPVARCFQKSNFRHVLYLVKQRFEDLSSQLQTQAVEQFKAPNLSNVISKPEPSTTAQDDKDVAETV